MAVRKSKTEESFRPEDFLKKLEANETGNFYVLLGEDHTRAEQLLETLRARLVPPGMEDFSLAVKKKERKKEKKNQSGATDCITTSKPSMGLNRYMNTVGLSPFAVHPKLPNTVN